MCDEKADGISMDPSTFPVPFTTLWAYALPKNLLYIEGISFLTEELLL